MCNYVLWKVCVRKQPRLGVGRAPFWVGFSRATEDWFVSSFLPVLGLYRESLVPVRASLRERVMASPFI